MKKKLLFACLVGMFALLWSIDQSCAQTNNANLWVKVGKYRLYAKKHPGSDFYRLGKKPKLWRQAGPTQQPRLAATLPAPNFAYSPTNLRKFVDSLPGLGSANKNNLGQYIPVAIPDTTKYAGADYYEIGLMDHSEQMHSDLPATGAKVRGYYQINTTDTTVSAAHYLGPLILAKRDRPVRVKFFNELPPGTNLFLPVDTTVMGAGAGSLDSAGNPCDPMMSPNCANYPEDRATLHLHGGVTPWISDGTPHQWISPAGENTPYLKGVSTQDVPDMPPTGAGEMTFYYPNQQSSRLMFYHDHAYGITRLNVYAGEVSGYLLTDSVEEGLISSGILPNLGGTHRYGIPLIIQDKTFVSNTTATTDPLWDAVNWGGPGNLWFPHVYEPNQDPLTGGMNPFGRWDYGPWVWPPALSVYPSLPHPSIVPEAFMDTPVINGTAYPYMVVQPKAYRFRILNGCNDRMLNLQLYYADASGKEVAMVPAPDGRVGGVPDATKVGPPMIQIGSEGGFLPAPVVLNSTTLDFNGNPLPAGTNNIIYVDYDTDRRSITFGNVLNKNLFLGPAERADIIIDFSQVPAGSNLILYNDAPAPVPAFDPRYDFYTSGPDHTAMGGAPSTLPGYGPNTRTLMQFQVSGTPAAPYNLAALKTALPTAFTQSQPAPLVPAGIYGDNKLTPTSTLNGYPVYLKTIAEDFDINYGRMNARLGTEVSSINSQGQQTFGFDYVAAPTEFLMEGQPQVWMIVHNGVDTHAVHFHLFDVQVINRVDWMGIIKPPDPNELGWKETVRMNPLENVIVAFSPKHPTIPFSVPDSIRPLDVTMPASATNPDTNFGNEYVWHCHLLGHEENDMMRPMVLQTAATIPTAPSILVAVPSILGVNPPTVKLTWLDNSANESGFTIQRATNSSFTTGVLTFPSLGPNISTFTDTTVQAKRGYYYRVQSFNSAGSSSWSNSVFVTTVGQLPIAPTNLKIGKVTATSIQLSWQDNSSNETNFYVQRSTAGTGDPWSTIKMLSSNTTSFTNTILARNKAYWYRVYASNSSGKSGLSNVVSATTLP